MVIVTSRPSRKDRQVWIRCIRHGSFLDRCPFCDRKCKGCGDDLPLPNETDTSGNYEPLPDPHESCEQVTEGYWIDKTPDSFT